MAAGAADWAWKNSRASNGSLIVLLAIAHECGEGEFTEMKIADLAVKCRLSDRAVRMAVKDLLALGELSVDGGRGAVGRYAVRPTSAESADVHRQNLPTLAGTSAKSADVGHRQNLPTLAEEPQVKASSAKSADVEIPDAFDFGSVVSGERSSSKDMSGAPRPDVDRICQHLADRIAGNGSKRPEIGKRWNDAARLMIDKDGLTEQQVHDAIDYSQQHHFWHRNILSMDKLRHHMDRLRLDWKAEREKTGARKSGGKSNPDNEYAEALQRIQARKENGNGTRGNGDNRPAGQVSIPPAAD